MTTSALNESFQALHARSRATLTTPWPLRRQRLQALRSMLLAQRHAIAAAIGQDFGQRSVHETELLEIVPCLQAIDHALAHGQRWMQPQRRATSFWYQPARNQLLPQPLGVIGIVVPWNYPLLLSIAPLVCALAAGNLAMLKLSEDSPAFGALLAQWMHSTLAPDEVTVINGDAEVARAFCALPFDHLLFTGSTATGRAVMRAASDNLVPVTLELGGKSPAIIGPGADVESAVTRIMSGKLLNAGQTCIAPDYVLLPRGQEAQFITAARKFVAQCYPALNHATRQNNSDYTSIINPRHFARLQALLDDALAQGASVTPLATQAADAGSRCLPPLILTSIPATARIMQEEIFGPLLPLISYDRLDEAIAMINARPRPLALYVFERDQERIDQVLQHTVAGGVSINDTLLHIAQNDLPFGGIGASGMGAYHGEFGFRSLSHMKPVFRQRRLNPMRWFLPPYGRVFKALMKLLIR
ncbi:coniferyl aldehyde dehydrogenase [Herbaspirillum autotrophicum]|uniref:coniferyl aldehyde dehydrogenase n=1 Tax=Herbaspirillum autotrophicum TaxID=180195 RepID=UPI00067E50F3|nr:coniferyl aldehyde dehydrogenase [Herbaspirillum autotrophicum]